MKKLFSICLAASLALVVNASIVTSNVSWDFGEGWTNTETGHKTTLNAWSSTEKWGWVEGAEDYEQLVIEVADHTTDIVVYAKFNVGDNPQIESAGVLHPGTNSLGIDIKSDILQYLKFENWSDKNEVTITVTGLYFRKATGTQIPVQLWGDPKTYGDWAASDTIIATAKFSDVQVGDILELNYSRDALASYYQLKMQTAEGTYPAFLGGLDEWHQYNINSNTNSTGVSFTILDNTDITNLKSNGLRVNAKNITITGLTLIKHDNGGGTAIDNVNTDTNAGIKVLRDGVLYIQRGETLYNMQGQIVK